ncbi:MAG: ClpXP protease specificity-enhancing factor [Thauera phenolivorans]|uniref:ClpXP protease specificity-enhancing factor n=1 Tax=Thauera phenolivorans TaxID=1792543 RepID=A0A7X7LYE2_9RHOO|nr:ClpXP protease specificity-enhancing factor [Thauera phenolivorans]NLF55522.1 ClpXP protease specificity-enhancing factor [Thauera phenolivorans]
MSNVSTKPYLIRAIYEWCVDQGFTPYLATLVDADTRVPPGYAKDGQIVLNIGPDAAHKLAMENDFISFQARFGGVAHSLLVPVDNVVAIYARENGQGMAFEVHAPAAEVVDMGGDAEADATAREGSAAATTAPDEPPEPPPPARGSHLKVIK